MSKNQEKLLGLIILVVVVSFFGFKYLESNIDEEAGLRELEEAIASKDMDYLEGRIEVEGADRDLTREEFEEIVYLLDNMSLSNLKQNEEEEEFNIFLIEEGLGIIRPKRYKLGLRTYDLKILENPAGTKVFINGDLAGNFGDDGEFTAKNLIPGHYKIELEYETEYGKIKEQGELVAFTSGYDNEIEYSLRVPERYIEVSSNEESAELIVNGKQTGIKIYKPYELGPLGDEEILISARALIDGNLYESESYRVDSYSSGSYQLDIDYDPGPTDEEIISSITGLINSYEVSFVHSVNSGDEYLVSMYLQNGSPIMKSQKKLIKNLYEDGIKEDLLSYEIKDIDILSQEKILVTVEEEHMIYYSDGSKEEVSNTWTYTAVYENDRYLLREIN